MVKKKKNVYNFTLYFKIKLFLRHIYLTNSVCLYSVHIYIYCLYLLENVAEIKQSKGNFSILRKLPCGLFHLSAVRCKQR